MEKYLNKLVLLYAIHQLCSLYQIYFKEQNKMGPKFKDI